MRIRKAKKEDLKEVVDIFITESKKRPYLQKWTKKNATDDISSCLKKGEIWVAVIEGKVVGFIIAGLVSSNKKMVYIGEFWLIKNYQGKGIGKSLLVFVEKYYKKKGVNLVRLASHKKSRALGFYNKLNYKESVELVFMDKKL